MTVITESTRSFLAEPRITVVGASDRKESFGGVVYRALKEHGYDVVAVHPSATSVDGDRCYPDLAAVPGPLGGVLVMVKAALAPAIIESCVEHGVTKVWLFKGIGKGASSDEAVRLCEANGIEVVAGACPLMFLEPVAGVHRFHRGLRHLNRSLTRAA